MALMQRRRANPRELIALMIGIVPAAMTIHYSHHLYAFPLYPYLGGPISLTAASVDCFFVLVISRLSSGF